MGMIQPSTPIFQTLKVDCLFVRSHPSLGASSNSLFNKRGSFASASASASAKCSARQIPRLHFVYIPVRLLHKFYKESKAGRSLDQVRAALVCRVSIIPYGHRPTKPGPSPLELFTGTRRPTPTPPPRSPLPPLPLPRGNRAGGDPFILLYSIVQYSVPSIFDAGRRRRRDRTSQLYFPFAPDLGAQPLSLASDPASWTPGSCDLPLRCALVAAAAAAAPPPAARHLLMVLATSIIATLALLSVAVASPSHRVATPGPGFCPSCTPLLPCHALALAPLDFPCPAPALRLPP
ncbi:hypothetical protein F52700_12608 [Fusarium sp. NRRL 52700]|nr:hypothetical protein F52700_12608 [Fusarium sp. NRRL 52700]